MTSGRSESSGKLFCSNEVQIRHPETRELLGPDQKGEIVARGVGVFFGYCQSRCRKDRWNLLIPKGGFLVGT